MPIAVNEHLRRWLYVAMTLLGISLVVALTFSQQIWASYVQAVWAPKLERELGFHAATRDHPVFGSSTFVITAVVAGGVFDRAGIRPGDVPTGYKHAFAAEFYNQLEHARGKATVLRCVRAPEREALPVELQFTVRVPRGDA